jgi:ABC-type sugar transport system ATPase subunit
MSSITIQNLTKRFGATIAVDDLTLHIEDREFVVIVGPTGAGKTTTLRCVAGLETPDKGSILLDSRNVTRVSPAARDLAFVFQNYALYSRKTVFENIAFPLQARGSTEIQAEVASVARKLRISHLLSRLPAQLSGGEQQRVALGRALVRTPRAFLMDEPLTNLDFQLRTQMRSELKRIQQELNITFFYVTNDQLEALSMGDRIAVLNHGVLQQVGPPQEVYEKPANLFVAAFIGSTRMNFLKCTYNANTSTLIGTNVQTNLLNSWTVRVPDALRAGVQMAKDPAKLILGIRPEDVELLIETNNNDLKGQVYVIEPLGDRNIYDIQLGSDLIKVKASPMLMLAPGTWVSVRFNMTRAHLFDAVTEQALI